MEELLGFAVAVIIISTSGVMSPGPLFVANVFYGAKGGASAGLKMSYGHTVVEIIMTATVKPSNSSITSLFFLSC